jgi:hypothetical protein
MNEISGNFVDGTTREEKLDYYHRTALKEKQRRDFHEWLLENSAIDCFESQLREDYSDFTIGDTQEDYPPVQNDLRVISRSSISNTASGLEDLENCRFVSKARLHLPAAPEELKEDIDSVLSLESFDQFVVYYGSGRLGGMDAPDGVITPHIVLGSNSACSFSLLKLIISRCIEVYEDVYNNGELALSLDGP